jgi:2-hydroxy-6-oxonona-2,4-dienedioate hydrolase
LSSNNPKKEVMDFINILGYQIRYIKISNPKSKETLVLLHGLGASAERWSELLPLLSDYNVVIPDIIGFGYSEKPLIHYHMDFFLKFLDEFFYKLEINKPIGIGSSFGGQLILEYYFKNPDFFKKMILISPAGTHDKPTLVLRQYIFSSLYPTYENTERAFKTMAAKNYKVKDSTIKDFVNRMKLPNAKHSLISTLLALRKDTDFQSKLKQIEIPTLVMWGSEDTFIPRENIEYFKGIPLVETRIMEDCGHSPFVEKPLLCYKIINTFIES